MPEDRKDPASLDNLKDILLPEPVAWWPPAPGWYLLGFALLLAAAAALYTIVRRRNANAYRRTAQERLNRLDLLSQDPSTSESALREIPALIKRVALATWPREEVAPLSGPAFMEFLDASANTHAFTQGAGSVLPALSYRVQPGDLAESDRQALFHAVREWIASHRAGERNTRP